MRVLSKYGQLTTATNCLDGLMTLVDLEPAGSGRGDADDGLVRRIES